MKPLVFVFRLHEIPFVASALASLKITLPEAARTALHYAYDAADEACAAELDAVEEPEEDEATSKDVLAFDHAVADTLASRWPQADDRTLRFGYNAGLSFDDAAAKLKSGGFDVKTFDGVADDDVIAPWRAVDEFVALVTGGKAIDPNRLEVLTSQVPAPLYETRAMKELVTQMLAKSPPLRLTAPTLTNLFAAEAAPAEELARAADASAKDIAPVTASAKDIAGDLAPMLNALKNVFGQPSSASLDVVFEGHDPPTNVFASDLRWSRDGTRLLVAAEAVRVFERTSDHGQHTDNVALGIAFKPVIEYAGLPRRRGTAALSADYVGRERIITGYANGHLRGGSVRSEPATHDILQKFGEPVSRVRTAPRGGMALIVGEKLMLAGDDGVSPREIGKAGADVVWAPDSSTLATCVDGELVVYDAAGTLVRTVRVGASAADVGPHDASPVGYLVPTAEALVIVGHDGAVRRIPCLVGADTKVTTAIAGVPAGRVPGAAAASPDGRIVMVLMTWEDADHSDFQVFDLAHDQVHSWSPFLQAKPTTPFTFSPTGDAFAFAPRTSVWVDAFALGFVRDEPGEWLSVVQSLTGARQYAMAQSILERIPAAKHRHALARGMELAKHAIEVAVPKASAPPPPLPKAPPKRAAAAPGNSPFADGQIVEHARFGRGVVQETDGEGHTARVTVDFAGNERTLPATALRAVE